LVLLGGIYVVWQFWNKKLIQGVVFSTVAIVAGMYLLFAESSPFAVIMARLTGGDNLSDLTTKRSDLFAWYWEIITEDLKIFFFGQGMQAALIQGKGAHNIYVEITYYTGFIGLVLILAFWGSLIRMLERQHAGQKKQSILAKYIVVFILAVLYLALQGMFQVITYAGIFLAFLSVYLSPKECEKPSHI
jgi:O-antigen ligase